LRFTGRAAEAATAGSGHDLTVTGLNYLPLSGHPRLRVGYWDDNDEPVNGRPRRTTLFPRPKRDDSTVTDSGRAVFLSYASQDAPAAERLCNALRGAGVEVWFDQSELRGGDTWDQSIRKQIKGCSLFVPMISANTQSREEGYFRREWRLAVERAGDMAGDRAFLLPVVIDGTSDSEARVPEKFREVQWTRLPQGANTDAFVEHVHWLLSGELSREPSGTAPVAARVSAGPTIPKPVAASWRSKAALLATIAIVVLALGYLVANRWVFSKHGTDVAAVPGSAAQSSPATGFNPPPHSIAVLPFADMSEKKDQEYFSDGLTEELLNALSDINGLQVAARTSAFSFKGTNTDIATVARKLNVGAVLEGSVRRSSHTIRVTAQLINAVTGFHLWSKTYDRDSGDVLKLQTDIATSVANALQVTLLGDTASRIELGGTSNPAAFDAYLRGVKLLRLAAAITPMQCETPMQAFSDAIALDDKFALAYASRAFAIDECSGNSRGWLQQPKEQAARADAERAIELAPGLAEGFLALSRIEQNSLDFESADHACARALALGPGNVQVLYECSLLSAYLGHADAAISNARRAVALDPLNPLSHRALGDTLRYTRHYGDAIAAYQASIAADPEHSADAGARRGVTYFLAGDLPSALSSCEANPDTFRNEICRAVVYHRIGRHGDAAAVLASITKSSGDAAAYQYAEIFAQWGDHNTALDWLEKAVQLRDPGLVYTKTDPLLDPLRKEPRFQAIERQLKFPT
jgi:TolB-like protein